MSAYLFVHFKEKTTPDGEQVYFGLSKDGFHWESVNDGTPVAWAYHGDCGARDFTIVRARNLNKFLIIATDLSLAYGLRGKYDHSWDNIRNHGSKCFSVWESRDLVEWTEQRLMGVGYEGFGCMWAPDVIYDRKTEEYLLHWSSEDLEKGSGRMEIFYSRTKDFVHFTKPEVLYGDPKGSVIDSAMYEEDGRYYLFVKEERKPLRIRLMVSDHIDGGFTPIETFDEYMKQYEGQCYEGATAITTEDGQKCLFLDYYGARGKEQGYVPFLSDSFASGKFVRSDASFAFPYGYKHGTILEITDEEYERIKKADFSDKGW